MRDIQDKIIAEIEVIRTLGHLRTYRKKILKLKKYNLLAFVDMWMAYNTRYKELER